MEEAKKFFKLSKKIDQCNLVIKNILGRYDIDYSDAHIPFSEADTDQILIELMSIINLKKDFGEFTENEIDFVIELLFHKDALAHKS